MQNKLLVIEDEPMLSELISAIGEDAGYEVLLAEQIPEIENAMTPPPSVVLMDLNLPDADFATVLATLASSKCDAHLIIASGTSQDTIDGALQKAKGAGLKPCLGLAKPFDIERLQTVLEDLRVA